MLLENHQFFKRLYAKSKYRRIYNFGSALFIWVFLAVAQPFGIYNTNLGFGGLVLFLLPFALLWLGVSYLIDRLIGLNLRPLLDLLTWLVKIAIFVQGIYLVRELLCECVCIDLREYLEIWLASFLIFMLTYAPFALYGRYYYYHSLLGSSSDSSFITLEGGGNETISIDPQEVFFLRSDDNYVEIHFASERDYKILRATLTSIEEQLKELPMFVRIHRSYIGNTQYLLKPAKKGEVKLKAKRQEINLPVSKTYQNQIDTLFTHPK